MKKLHYTFLLSLLMLPGCLGAEDKTMVTFICYTSDIGGNVPKYKFIAKKEDEKGGKVFGRVLKIIFHSTCSRMAYKYSGYKKAFNAYLKANDGADSNTSLYMVVECTSVCLVAIAKYRFSSKTTFENFPSNYKFLKC